MAQKGDAASESEFVRLAEAKAKAQIGTDKKKAGVFKAQAVQAYAELYEENKGKPSSKQAEEVTDRLVVKAATRPHLLEGVFGKGEEPEWMRRARLQKEGAQKTSAPPPAPTNTDKVPVVGPNGMRGSIAADKVDAWLAARPGWRKT